MIAAVKQTPKFHVQLGFHTSFPLCSRAPGQTVGLGKDSSSASPPLLMAKTPHVLRKLRNSKSNYGAALMAQPKELLPTPPDQSPPERPIFQLCWPHAELQVSIHRLSAVISLKCCFSSSDTQGVVSKISLKFNRIWRP